MRSIKPGFALYVVWVMCGILCLVTRLLVMNGYKIPLLTALHCKLHSQQTHLWMILALHKRLITERYDFFKEITQKTNKLCVMETWGDSVMSCWYDPRARHLVVTTQTNTHTCHWAVKKQETGEYVFSGYTTSSY
jgi:hypothetical protein